MELAFRVKICGITSATDGQVAADAGADAIGLNFYNGSPRCVSPEEAKGIVRQVPNEIVKVGVFVNQCSTDMKRIVGDVGLDAVQLHGDEQPTVMRELGGLGIIKAFRVKDKSLDSVTDFLEQCGQLGRLPHMLLVDAYDPDRYGGTGNTLPWAELSRMRDAIGRIPLVLAGGLTPQNVVEAISIVRPDAVDTASGVEVNPVTKDAELVRQFVSRALGAFQAG